MTVDLSHLDILFGSLFSFLSLTCPQQFFSVKQKNLAMGKKKFNMDPKKGIEFLITHNLLKETPEEVAQFLYKVSKQQTHGLLRGGCELGTCGFFSFIT